VYCKRRLSGLSANNTNNRRLKCRYLIF
jgi:hypothetical protein